MRKYLLFVLFLCIHWVAIGQTLYDYRYWFDGDEETMQTGSSAVSSWQMNLDLQSLNDNMHTLYLQVKDTAGVWSSPMIRRFLKIPTGAGGNYLYWFDEQEDKATMSGNTIDVSSLSEGMHTLRLQYNGGNSPSIPKSALFIKYPVTVGGTTSFNYWFDSDATIANTISGSGESFIDVSGLEEGFHTIHVQFNGAQPSVPLTSMFIKYPVTVGVASSINYWFDSDATNIYTLSGSGENLIDISGLEDGFHTIHAQYNGDQPSVPLTSMFIKIPQTMGVNSFNCLFYVDGELHKQEEVSASEGIIKWDVDVSEIPHGLHRCQAIVMTPSGVATGIKESFFYRAMTTTEKQSMKCYYSIDNSGDYIQAGTLSENVYHFDLDVSSVSDGFHRISYMLLSDDGTCSKVMSSYFIKTPLGGDGIMQYDYWINDNDDNVHTTKLDARENPFKLITLLPVETCPIRSSCFDFNIVDGKPIVYAKNDFHIRFYDTAGRMTEATKNYIDENVSREVTSITEITGVHTTITTAKPANDSILWYKMNASAGDSIAIKSNQSCTINIFSASGKEVHSASGSDAVSFGGIYAYEDGTYYIAVHDAISSSSKDLELNFFQLNKYAIVDYDIHKVGNGGFSTITFNGNGYYSLDSISISRGDTIIPCVNIDRHSNTKVEATFDFGGIPNGDYDIKFLFQDDTINVSKGLYVEEAKDIELDFSVDHESVFYIGHEPYYNITVTNSGNSSAIGVPVYIYVETKLSDGIPRIKLSGLDTPSPLDGLDMSEYSASEIGRLKDLADDIGDNLNFMCYRDFDEESNDSVLIRANYFFVDIPPMTTKTIKVSIATTDSVECYAVVPDIWPTYTEWNPSDSPSKALALLSSSNNNAMDYFCCYHDRVECVMNFVAAGADFTSLVTTLFGPELATVTAVAEISSCVSSSISSISSSVASIFCSEEAAEGEKSLY
ncbi:MAG: hypothetical protein Q4D41_12415, partial [Prevotellaceae bacterium]|nr:hypothetical protein [Prevotellaceae bacterium]